MQGSGLIDSPKIPSAWIWMDIQEISIRGGFERSRGYPWIAKMIQVDIMDHDIIYEMN
jgi:hypothetical protein